MDQFLEPANIEELAKAIACELLRELRSPAMAFDTIAEPVQRAIISQIGPLTVDMVRYEATLHGEPIDFKPREFALLALLAQNPGRAFTRKQLLDLVWPDACAIDTERTVDVHVSRIRSKLGRDNARLIRTIPGIGYKLETRTGAVSRRLCRKPAALL